jgi:transglutaminase-like putative cysteine protease
VLTTFDGREWKPLLQPLRSRTGLPGLGPQLEVAGEPVRYEVTLEPSNRPWILVLDVAAEAPRVPGMDLFVSPELTWIGTKPVAELVRYQASSYTRFRYGPKNIGGVPFEYTELPEGSDPRTRELAAQMKANPAFAAGGPIGLVNAALTRLRTGGYTYTLDPGTYGANTADEFWFDRKEGFCEHIASSFVILMRAMEIPARVVTGYQGGELNPVDGYWVVRQSDAHAWAEVWLAGQGWVRIDPTSSVAPGRIASLQRPPRPANAVVTALGTVNPNLVSSVRAMWDAMNNGWNQWVLNYTQSRQLNLLKNLGFAAPSWEDLSYLLIMVIVVVALGAAAWTLWDRREHDPWLRLLHQVRRRLAQAGIVVPPAAPPRQMAALVQGRWGPQAQALADWLLQLESQRYARVPPASLRRLQRQFRKLVWPV